MPHTVAYANWKAPAEDGGVLVWPEPVDLLKQTLENQRKLSTADDVLIQNTPLPVLRRSLRAFVGHDDAKPLIATGHQTELHHPGVWAKNALIDAIATALDGRAYHLAVDTDKPKHLSIRWPGGSEPISDDPQLATAEWAGLLATPTPSHLEHLQSHIRAASGAWNYEPAVYAFLDSLRRLVPDEPPLSASLTNALHELDWSLGLRHDALLASPLWMSEGFLALAHHVMARAPEFASHYNAALADYRSAEGIRGTMRPMPDLFVSERAGFETAVEMPFWLDDLTTGHRVRPSVFAYDGGMVLQLLDEQTFEFARDADGIEAAQKLATWLRKTNHRLAPRALTLTLFVRLLLADQFVHGIGGGRYDQVTDRLIQSHFGIEPPRFAVATATMFLPQALGRTRVCVPCVKQEGHRLKHQLLGDIKFTLLNAIAAAPRDSLERGRLFAAMHRDLTKAQQLDPRIIAWRTRLDETVRREQEELTLFDREVFYGMQPRERLVGLIEKFAMRFDVNGRKRSF